MPCRIRSTVVIAPILREFVPLAQIGGECTLLEQPRRAIERQVHLALSSLYERMVTVD
jgi:hypothetical protein